MTNGQKFKRVLFSRYGVLTVLTLLLVFYILSFFTFPTKGLQSKDNPLYVVVYFLVLRCPFGFFFWGWEKFDEEGSYTKKFVPELKNLSPKYLFKPWLAPKEVLEKSGIELGKNYPNQTHTCTCACQEPSASMAQLGCTVG